MSNVPTPEDVDAYVRSRDDFSLELAAFRELKKWGWSARHGGTYIDPVTEKPRQFDLQAHRTWRGYPETSQIGIMMAVECKNISSAVPIIVSRVPRPADDAFHCVISKRKRSLPYVELAIDTTNPEPGELSLYRTDAMVGKSILVFSRQSQKGSEPPEDPYSKWAQALASCHSLCRDAAKDLARVNSGAWFVMPVLVVADSSLWIVDYDEHGAQGVPTPADEATLFVDRAHDPIFNHSGPYRTTHLHIFTLTGFAAALSGFESDPRTLLRIFEFCTRRTERGV